MAIYPHDIDSDATLPRVDDNITEIGSEAINALRDAVFAIEKELGLGVSGVSGTLANRLLVSINPNGSINASALAAAGLVTLPITNNQISINAGIEEKKLNLNHSTTDLYTLINGALLQLSNLAALVGVGGSDLNAHITGAQILSNGKSARHVASHIDLNAVSVDPRDPYFSWTGLKDKNNNLRSATQVASALLQINNDLTSHENSTANAHVAQGIYVDTSNFTQIPLTANNVQSALEAIDHNEALVIEPHRSTQHANGIPVAARSEFLIQDGYYDTIVPYTIVNTYLTHPTVQTAPIDDIFIGDDVISFKPSSNAGFIFDTKFSQVKVGDIISVNYGNGIEPRYTVDSIRNIAGSSWTVRINGTNLFDSQDGYTLINGIKQDGYALAKIERPKFDLDTQAVLAVAHANPNLSQGSSWVSSLIVADPKVATAVGIDFDPNKLDSTHYKLYLQFYPTGNPTEKIIDFSYNNLGIDVTGNQGATPGRYTIDSVVAATNAAFRSYGFNYRFIAFNYKGNFGIATADAINGCGFSIVNSSGPGSNNVIDDTNNIDPLGLSQNRANLASPPYSSSYSSSTLAQTPTKIFLSKKHRNYLVDGVSLDYLAKGAMVNQDGYWPATIINRNVVGITTIEVTYSIKLDLRNSGIKPGKTITIQPSVSFTDLSYSDVDYGRFIIKNVYFPATCAPGSEETQITIINGVHGTGTPVGFTSPINTPVNIYFSYDSVSFDADNIIDQSSSTNYYRLHEVYINRFGKTFSHEVARMPIQSETTSLLSTSNNSSFNYLPGSWNIINISPKLRGHYYSSGDTKKQIRFNVTSYNSTTGEFDGYLSDNAYLKKGPVTAARKNTIARFYDHSNIDYIDIEYIENGTSSTSIMSNNTYTRYVDIQLFPSLQLNNEYLLLAKCNLAQYSNGGNFGFVTQSLNQFKEFGTLSEQDFTTSAINFIEAGDKYLHNNGIIRGFELGLPFIPSSGLLYFNGGLALVDGHIATVNDTHVEIPQIAPSSSLPQIVTWAICVNKNNELEPIIITDVKQQFFIQNKSPNYYVTSVTFPELISTRKDLTPIYLVNATIASITLGTPIDVRRFINNQSIGSEFVLASEPGYGANFTTFDAMSAWINKFGSVSNKVKLRGTFNISSTVDLSALNNSLMIDGDGTATINVTSAQGIKLGSNVTFKNINFNYYPALSYDINNKINVGNGCLYLNNGSDVLNNILIEKCNFSSTLVTGTRPPFISIESNGGLVKNIKIVDGYFSDSNTTLVSGPGNCAFISIANTSNSTDLTLSNINISNNKCAQNQIIHIGHTSSSSNIIINCLIENNNCGTIGYLCKADTSQLSAYESGKYRNIGLSISKNTCHLITHLLSSGNYAKQNYVPYQLGNVTIDNNYVNYINVYNNSSTDQYAKSSLSILNNILNAYDAQDSGGYIRNNFSNILENSAIVVSNVRTSTSDKSISCKIIGNKIHGSIEGANNYYYTRGIIISRTGSIISNNEIYGVKKESSSPYPASLNGVGIAIYDYGNSPNNSSVTISNNQIHRESNDLYAYVSGAISATSNLSCKIVDNYFDNYEVSSGDQNTIKNITPNLWIAERNVNQTNTIILDASFGTHYLHSEDIGDVNGNPALTGVSIGSADFGILATKLLNSGTGVPAYLPEALTTVIKYITTGKKVRDTYILNLHNILPRNVKVVSFTISAASEVQTANTVTSTANTTVYLGATNYGGYLQLSPTYDYGSVASSTTITNTFTPSTVPIRPVLSLLTYIVNSSDFSITISPISLTYRW